MCRAIPFTTAKFFSGGQMPGKSPAKLKPFAIGALALAFVSLAPLRAQSPSDAGVVSFSADRLLAHVRTLSSNEFEGRAPGSKGEKLTLTYLQKQFREIGAEPGNPDGTYLQNVPLVGIRPDPNMELTITGHVTTLHAKYLDDFVAWTKRTVDSVHL